MSISNCGHDENGGYRNGKAGDNNGTEWQIRSYYVYGNGGWNCVLRHPNAEVQKMISDYAVASAKNDHIGYDQNQRGTYWQHLTTSNYNPAEITIDCEADCSSGVAGIVKAVGYRLGIQSLKDVSADLWTGNMRSALKSAGFEVLTDSKYLNSDSYLKEGDILLNEKHHTCINVTNGSSAGGGSSTTGHSTLRRGSKGSEVVELQNKLIAKGYSCGSYGADASFGNATETAVKKFQSDNGLEVDGIVGKNTWAKLDSSSKVKSHSTLRKGSKGEEVKTLQSALKQLGYDIGSWGADGSFGSCTDSAVRKFQADHNLEVDGIVGKNTWAKIDSLT